MPDPVLEAEALSKRFGGLRAMSEVSLAVAAGEIHAVIGPNGAGKTTLINTLSGDLAPTSGHIRLRGRDVTALPPARRGLAGIGRSYQKTTIFPRQSAAANVRLAAQAHSARATSLFARADSDETVETAKAALAEVGLAARAAVSAGLLSHGEQRQLEIAMVLATDPLVMLLDEPLAGMGMSEAREMVGLIGRLKAGRAILLVEHDMDAVFSLADTLTVMVDGRVVASGAPETVRRDPAVRTAYLGHDDPAGEAAA